MATIGELLVEINGDNSGLNKTLKGTESSLMGAVGKMAGAIGGLSLAWKAVDLAMKGIEYNKAAEQAEISFGVFLGSAGAAKSMIEELRDLAKETPLEFAEVRDAAKRLSAFGIEANKIIPSMRMLADVSAGLQIPMGDLAYLFGTIKTQGKAMTVDINQFANRGIPIWTELAKVTGKAGTELRKLVEEGGIGFPQIEQAFKNMTSEGGKFFNMAVKQMDSLAGSQSNLNDAFDVFLGQLTKGAVGPLKDFNNGLSKMLTGSTELMAQLEKNGKSMLTAAFDPVSLIKAATQIKNINSGLEETKKRGNAAMGDFRDTIKESAAAAKKTTEEIAKAIEETKLREATEISIKQEYYDQFRLINSIIQSGKDKAKNEADAAAAKVISDAKEATGRQIVLGYQNQAINNQIKAIGLEKDYQDEIEKTAKLYKDISDSLSYAGTQLSSLARSIGKFGDEELSKLVQGFADIANNAGNLVAALGKGDYIAAAVSGVALIADAWSMMFGGRNKAQEEADKKAREAEAERVKAVKELESEYVKKFENDLTRLERERDERVAYARSIGADVLNIERYYAGEIAKINKQKIGGTKYEEDAVSEKIKDLNKTYTKMLQDEVDKSNAGFKKVGLNWVWTIEDMRRNTLESGIFSGIDEWFRSSLEDIEGELSLFKTRFSQAFDGIGSSLSDAFKSGATKADFRTTIMNMLRDMAIDAAIIAGGFQEKFKEIGVMIAEALKDGLSESELARIDLSVQSLYSSGIGDISKINDLFNKAGSATNITGGGTTINIATTSDPLTIANALSNVQQSLAYQGVVA